MIKKLVKLGNYKIGKDTFIFNMGSYTHCPSKKRGLCTQGKKCYAKKGEIQYPDVLPYRCKQEKYWLNSTKEQIAIDICVMYSKKKKMIPYFRVNESGDFHSQECVEKLKYIAKHNPAIIFYTYTHRRDLKYNKIPSNLIIQTSNFRRKGMNAFYTVKKFSEIGGRYRCNADCSVCHLCKFKHGKIIEVIEH